MSRRSATFDTRTAKAAMHKRLHAEKRFEDYVRVREQLKRDGINATEAWRYAAKQFPPLDGSPLEIQELLDEAAMTGAVQAMQVEQSPTPAAAVAVPTPTEVPEFYLDGMDWANDVLQFAAAPSPAPPEPAARLSTPPAHTPPVPPPPPTAGADGTGWIKYSKSVADQAAGMAEAWAKLTFAVVQLQKSGGGREVSDWVFNNALIPVNLIEPENVPSVGALGLLKWVQQSTANYTEFIRSIWSKSLPTKSQMDAEGRFADDGRLQLAMLDDFEQSFSDAA